MVIIINASTLTPGSQFEINSERIFNNEYLKIRYVIRSKVSVGKLNQISMVIQITWGEIHSSDVAASITI